MVMNAGSEDVRERPTWQVRSVFDSTGSGGDFAYTVGLHEAGLPELHLWARPSLGDDPGVDWKFSSSDLCHVLNELAGLLVDRRIAVGSMLTREYDGGLATVRYRVDPPEDREALTALGIPPGAEVLPVRWSLHRPAEGPPRPLTPRGEQRARDLCADIVRQIRPRHRGHKEWVLAEPTFAVGQRYGPLTPVVVARAAQLWQAPDESICDLIHVAVRVHRAFSLGWVSSRAMGFARCAGRRAQLETLRSDADALIDSLTATRSARERWRSIVRRCDPALWATSDRPDQATIAANLAELVAVTTRAVLLTEAVADIADQELLLAGRGPWVSGLHDQCVPPGADWAAAQPVQAVVRELLGALHPTDVRALATKHRLLRDRAGCYAGDYRQVCEELEAWALVSAAGFPWHAPWSDSSLARYLGEPAGSEPAEMLAGLQGWATAVCCCLTHRARLSSGEVDVLAAPYRRYLPTLRARLNEPL